jgi:metal-responsive CopG/Arc/MetJ family transcriptional regulator
VRPVSVNLTKNIISRVDSLVKAGMYTSRGEAMRLMLYRAIMDDLQALDQIKENNNANSSRTVLISFKAPKGLISLLEKAMRIEGFDYRSEYIRFILTNHLIKLFNELREKEEEGEHG